jgi:hypothetical protein
MPAFMGCKDQSRMVIELLPAKDNINVCSKDRYGLTPLSWYARKGPCYRGVEQWLNNAITGTKTSIQRNAHFSLS